MTTATLTRATQTTDEEQEQKFVGGTPLRITRLNGGTTAITPEVADQTAQYYLDAAGVTLKEDETLSLNGRTIEASTIVPASEDAIHVLTVSDEIGNG